MVEVDDRSNQQQAAKYISMQVAPELLGVDVEAISCEKGEFQIETYRQDSAGKFNDWIVPRYFFVTTGTATSQQAKANDRDIQMKGYRCFAMWTV